MDDFMLLFMKLFIECDRDDGNGLDDGCSLVLVF